ncbi:hypothetical protein BC828DRAFT_53776 [Blastocladiella britannica]|nr:hypothetical protein BC828DRAFT_53776 [Blastocladiella britannica]
MSDPLAPLVFTIDKSAAKREAIRQAFGVDQPIKLCEFHIVQALRRRLDGLVGRGTTKKIVTAFRRVFVSRSFAEYKDARATFFATIWRLFTSAKVRLEVFKYFQRNWFSSVWLPYLLDASMPWSLSRSDFNTNNMLETLFCTFDTMILGNTVNHRVLDLVEKLVTQWIPHYVAIIRAGPSQALSYSQAAKWRALGHDAEVLAQRVKRSPSSTVHFLVPHSAANLDEVVIVNLEVPTCGCDSFSRFGRICEHIVAVSLWHTSGAQPPAPGTDDELAEQTQDNFAVETCADLDCGDDVHANGGADADTATDRAVVGDNVCHLDTATLPLPLEHPLFAEDPAFTTQTDVAGWACRVQLSVEALGAIEADALSMPPLLRTPERATAATGTAASSQVGRSRSVRPLFASAKSAKAKRTAAAHSAASTPTTGKGVKRSILEILYPELPTDQSSDMDGQLPPSSPLATTPGPAPKLPRSTKADFPPLPRPSRPYVLLESQ